MVKDNRDATHQKKNKDALSKLLPNSLLANKKWLHQQGLTRHALDNAVKSKALHLIVNGVYSNTPCELSWDRVVASLQRMEKSLLKGLPSTMVGGLTALDLAGLSHYLRLGGEQFIHLFSPLPLPSWIARLPVSFTLYRHSTSQLWEDDLLQNKSFFKVFEWGRDLPELYYSCPEKALFEVLVNLPEWATFEHVNELMQGMVNLSPRKLDLLLKGCKSIKAKRLFFWFAKRQNHSWFKKLDFKEYDLGSGKRVIYPKGKLDKDFLITVPTSERASQPF